MYDLFAMVFVQYAKLSLSKTHVFHEIHQNEVCSSNLKTVCHTGP